MANTDWNTLYSGAAAINRSGVLTAAEKRGAYVVADAEDPETLTPGNVLYLIFQGVLFWYDATDALTAHDGTTCIVTADGKRFKADEFRGVNSKIVPVLDQDLATPPGSPSPGDTYIVAASGTGAWTGKDEQFASYTARGWVFLVPNAWDIAYVDDEALFYHYNDSGVWTSGLPALTIADTSISLKKLKYFPLGVSVENQTTNTPPGSPADGVAYIVGGSPTGAWVGHSLELAIYETSAWVFYTPYEGAGIYDKDDGNVYHFDGSVWTHPAAGLWTHIETRVISSATATADFTGLSSYKALRITIVDLRPATDGVRLYLRISSDNGATYLATGTYEGGGGVGGGPATAYNPLISTANLGNAAGDGGLGGEILITDFNVAQKTKFLSRVAYYDGAAAFQHMSDAGAQTAQTAMDAFRLLFHSGNITSAAAIILEGAG